MWSPLFCVLLTSCRGLDNAGKTTIVKKFNGEDISTISPTLGFNIQTLEFEGYEHLPLHLDLLLFYLLLHPNMLYEYNAYYDTAGTSVIYSSSYLHSPSLIPSSPPPLIPLFFSLPVTSKATQIRTTLIACSALPFLAFLSYLTNIPMEQETIIDQSKGEATTFFISLSSYSLLKLSPPSP